MGLWPFGSAVRAPLGHRRHPERAAVDGESTQPDTALMGLTSLKSDRESADASSPERTLQARTEIDPFTTIMKPQRSRRSQLSERLSRNNVG